jgi:hypothetical protein
VDGILRAKRAVGFLDWLLYLFNNTQREQRRQTALLERDTIAISISKIQPTFSRRLILPVQLTTQFNITSLLTKKQAH